MQSRDRAELAILKHVLKDKENFLIESKGTKISKTKTWIMINMIDMPSNKNHKKECKISFARIRIQMKTLYCSKDSSIR